MRQSPRCGRLRTYAHSVLRSGTSQTCSRSRCKHMVDKKRNDEVDPTDDVPTDPAVEDDTLADDAVSDDTAADDSAAGAAAAGDTAADDEAAADGEAAEDEALADDFIDVGDDDEVPEELREERQDPATVPKTGLVSEFHDLSSSQAAYLVAHRETS